MVFSKNHQFLWLSLFSPFPFSLLFYFLFLLFSYFPFFFYFFLFFPFLSSFLPPFTSLSPSFSLSLSFRFSWHILNHILYYNISSSFCMFCQNLCYCLPFTWICLVLSHVIFILRIALSLFVSSGPTLAVRYMDVTLVKVRHTAYVHQRTPSV